MTLCRPCSAEHNAWLDARVSAPLALLVSIGVTTVAQVIEARRLRSEDHYELVRQQLRLIADNCKTNHREGCRT